MKQIVVLGSSGSIGVNTLNVVREFPEAFSIKALTVNSSIDVLEEQIEEFKPSTVVVRNEKAAQGLRNRVGDKCKVLEGEEGLLAVTRDEEYDILVSALVGFAGLAPTIEGIKRKKRIALANKETLVVAGKIITELCAKYGAEMLPVDSEHSAIFQCLVGEKQKEVNKLILTASGGPFRTRPKEELKNVTVKDALNHPNWKMGNKITIDSATMMNKGLEVIEAHWLFGLNKERIEVVIHPQSIIHSMVEFVDMTIKAQMSTPDMKLPIQYALSYPERFNSNFVTTELPKLRELTFFEPDQETFECLKLAYEVMEVGGTAPCILNAANEVAVDKFLKGQIGFLDIAELVKRALDKVENHVNPDLKTIFEIDRQTREFAVNIFN